jgi:hypothetical protein
LVAGQRPEFHTETFDSEQTKDRGGDGLHIADQRKRNIRQIKMGLGDKNGEERSELGVFLKNGTMNGKATFTDIDKGSGVFAEKGEGFFLHLKSLVSATLDTDSRCRIQLHKGTFSIILPHRTGIEAAAILLHQPPTLGQTQTKIQRTEHQDSDSFARTHHRPSRLSFALVYAKNEPDAKTIQIRAITLYV